MAFTPWAQQVRGNLFGDEQLRTPPPQELPPVEPVKPPIDYSKKDYGNIWNRRWWDEPWRNLFETTPEGGMGSLNWDVLARDVGIGVGLGTLGLAAAPAAGTGMLTAGGTVAGGSALASIPGWMLKHKLLTGLGAAGAYAGYSMLPQGGGAPGEVVPTEDGEGEVTTGHKVGDTRVNYGPTGIPFIQEWNGTEWVGTVETADAGPEIQPQVIEVGGQRFWWNASGGSYGTGGWEPLSGGAGGLTPEQQIEQARLGREHQMKQLEAQYGLEQQSITQQLESQRQQQAAGAAQQMSQMYAADPYKYWAQMGMGTPEAVARLTGGGVEAGAPMQQVPLSVPSAQWWQNLLPSEQQQISGGLNWLGTNPEDWYSMYQRMIPGLGQRQMEPVWAR